MSTKPSALLDYAKHQQGSNDEVVVRSAISRAYYSCFHSLSVLMEPFPGVKKLDTWLSHKELIHRLESWNVGTRPDFRALLPLAKNVAQKLKILRMDRTTADYYLHVDVGSDDLRECIIRADELTKKTAQLKIGLAKPEPKSDESPSCEGVES